MTDEGPLLRAAKWMFEPPGNLSSDSPAKATIASQQCLRVPDVDLTSSNSDMKIGCVPLAPAGKQ